MNINKKVQKRIEKLLDKTIYWDSNRSGYYTSDNLSRVYVDFTVNYTETKFKCKVQDIINRTNETYIIEL